jgi:hypothetical protein
MKSLMVIFLPAVLLVLSAITISGIVYAQSIPTQQSANPTTTYVDNYIIPNCQDNEANGLPAAPAYVGETASGESIIFSNGVPTTVIDASGAQTPYSPSMFNFLAGYCDANYGIGSSHNSNVPSGGTWKQVVESGTYGTQEPNLNAN